MIHVTAVLLWRSCNAWNRTFSAVKNVVHRNSEHLKAFCFRLYTYLAQHWRYLIRIYGNSFHQKHLVAATVMPNSRNYGEVINCYWCGFTTRLTISQGEINYETSELFADQCELIDCLEVTCSFEKAGPTKNKYWAILVQKRNADPILQLLLHVF